MVQQTKCEYCARNGQLVTQSVMQAQPHLEIERPWVFRVYMCRWHRSVESRKLAKHLVVVPFVEDSTLLDEYRQSRSQKQKSISVN
ncbi:hypothetical protein MUB04_14825 [Acinetobacter indicus]|uniref:hypothetical protein n=1 Tax=Acinetobacter TaxID=469 RepID=UPI0015D27E6B|nr:MULTISPECIES: hypothetical protein [Acinetobacter]MCP0917807.1 hypothetical protein [Acinetobacter indicus]